MSNTDIKNSYQCSIFFNSSCQIEHIARWQQQCVNSNYKYFKVKVTMSKLTLQSFQSFQIVRRSRFRQELVQLCLLDSLSLYCSEGKLSFKITDQSLLSTSVQYS